MKNDKIKILENKSWGKKWTEEFILTPECHNVCHIWVDNVTKFFNIQQ